MLRAHRALRPALLRAQLARCSSQTNPNAQAAAGKHGAERLAGMEEWTHFKREMLVDAAAAVVLAAATSSIALSYILTRANEREIRRRLVDGTAVPQPKISEFNEMEIARDADERLLKEKLEGVRSSYVLISGPHSQGKTTLVQQALRKIDAGRIYVSVPSAGTLPKLALQVGKAMNYDPNAWYRGPLLQVLLSELTKERQPPSDNWDLYEQKLIEIAREHEKARKRPPLLVIDNVNTMAKEDAKSLEKLKRFAKEMADQKLITVVFVTSDGRAPLLLTSGNASRIHVIQATDVSLEQAKATLIAVIAAAKTRGLERREEESTVAQPVGEATVQLDQTGANRAEVDKLVDDIVCKYTGGRVGFVHQAADKLRMLFEHNPHISLEDVRREVTKMMEAEVALAYDTRFRTTEAYTLMRALLGKHRKLSEDKQRDIVSNATLTMEEAKALEGLSFDLVRELCSGNMFWLRGGEGVDQQIISFQSAYAATIAEARVKASEPSASSKDGQQEAKRGWVARIFGPLYQAIR